MSSKFLLLLLAVCFSVSSSARTKTDVVVMSNGDRFTCEIKKLERGVLYASFDYIDGTIPIEWSKVVRIESRQLFIVNTQDGTVYEGTIQTPASAGSEPVKIEVLELVDSKQTLERNRVVELNQTSQSFWRQMSGSFDSGLIYTKGNETTQYNIGGEVRLRRELWRGDAALTSTLSKSIDVTAATRNQARIGARRLIGGKRKWYYSGAAEFLQSSQQGITLQTTLGGTVGRYLKDTNKAKVSIGAGLAYQETEYDVTIDSQSRPNALAGLIAGDLHLFKFKKTSLDATVSVLPILTQIGRLRTYVNTAYSVQIVNNLWLKISFYGNWDNRPPATFSGSDYGTSTGVSWSFN